MMTFFVMNFVYWSRIALYGYKAICININFSFMQLVQIRQTHEFCYNRMCTGRADRDRIACTNGTLISACLRAHQTSIDINDD